jgi:hypothetical protein
MIRTLSDTPSTASQEDPSTRVVMELVTDSAELARSNAQWARFDRNAAWLQARAADVYPRCRGRCICIAGEELFVADSAREAVALAKAVHPEDDGLFVRYIPREKVDRIYAH